MNRIFVNILIFSSVWSNINCGTTGQSETLKVYRPSEIIITKGQNYLTDAVTFSGDSMCVESSKHVTLGAKSELKILYVDTKEQKQISEAFTKHEDDSVSTPNAGVKLTTDNTKSIIFSLTSGTKALFVGATEEKCYEPYLISKDEKQKQFVHLTYIKCIPLTEVVEYKKRTSTATTTNPYVTGKKHLCFLPTLLTTPTCIEVSDKKQSYTMIISPYPQPNPKCPTTSKTCPVAPANATTNGTETAKQSAAPIIISVVVIVVVIIAGGVGYVMMKK